MNQLEAQRHARAIRSRRLQAAREIATHTPEEWTAMLDRFGRRCVRCASLGPVEKDHVVPLYRGGSDGIGNLQPLCAPCNASKGPESTNWAAYREQHGFR